MLKVFRDNIKYLSWILWVVIALFVLFVFVDFGSGVRSRNAGLGANTAARVGNRTVSMAEYQREYQQLQQLYGQMYGGQLTPEIEKQMQLPLQALNRAVNEQVLLAEAERLGLTVSDEELRGKILEQQVFQNDQGQFIGQDKYAQVLAANHYTVASFEDTMRKQILREKLNDALRNGIYISDDEIQKSYRDQVEKAKIRYVELPRARFQQEAQPTPAEVSAYFEAHKQEYRLPEQREGAYLLVEPDRLRDQVNLSDKDLQDYYSAHKDEFTRPERVRARHILVKVTDPSKDAEAKQRLEQARQRIQGGADFAKVAGEVSEDPGSKARGGDLDFFGRGQMVKEFEDAAFGAKTGELVGPVKSPFGYHLLQVTDRQPPGVEPFAQAKEQIRARLAFSRAGELAQQKAKALATQLAKDKPKGPEALAALAKQNPGVTYADTGKLGAQDPLPGLGRAPQLNAAAFALKKGQVTDAIQVPRGWAVLYVKDVLEPRVPQLADVEPRVRQALLTQKQQQAAVDKLKQERAAGKTLDQIAADLGLQAKDSPEFGAQGGIPGLGVTPEINRAALALQTGQIGGPLPAGQGAVLFAVKERKNWDPLQFATARQQTRASLEQEKLGQLLGSLVERRRKELGVEFDRALLERMGISPEAAAQRG